MVNSVEEICNLAMIELGEKPNIKSIELPETDSEDVFATQYDTSRKSMLREVAPSFALKRTVIAESPDLAPPFGYDRAFTLPSNCLKFLGVGNIEDKTNAESVEGGVVYTNKGYDTSADDEEASYALNIRYVIDKLNPSDYTSDFVKVLALQLAIDTCESITGSTEKKQSLKQDIAMAKAKCKSIGVQENPTIRISRSKFLASRDFRNPSWGSKK